MNIFYNNNEQVTNAEICNTISSKRLYKSEIKIHKIVGFVRSTLSLLIVVVTLFLINTYYNRSAQKYLKEQVTETMSKVSTQLSLTFSNKVYKWYDELGAIEQYITLYDDSTGNQSDIEKMNEYLSGYKFNTFDSVGVLTDDGSLIVSDGCVYDVSKDSNVVYFLENNMNRFSCVLSNDKLNDKFVFAIPYVKNLDNCNLKIKGVFGFVNKDSIAELLTTDAFGENLSYVVISDVKGNVIVDSNSQRKFDSNILETFNTFADNQTIENLSNDLLNGNTNTYELMGVTQRFLIYNSPISQEINQLDDSITSWRLLILTSTQALNKNITGLFTDSKILISSIIICMFLILVIVGFSLERRKKQNLVLESTDSLTGLLNNRRFQEDANHLIHNGGGKYAVVSINILQFKMIMKRFDLERSDQILKVFSENIQNFLRDDEIASRNYSDRFIILLNVSTKEGIERIRNLDKHLRNSVYPYDVKPILSIGVYCLKKSDKNISTPIVYSRFAQSTIRMGHIDIDNIAFYDDTTFEKHQKEANLEKMASDALDKKKFVVYYQLKHGIGSNDEWVGCEALVRWENEQYGFISPADFIELFERNGFIVRLDCYVFETVCENLRYCIDNGVHVLPVSINLSKCELEVLDFLEKYEKIMNKYNIPRELIEFELTETMAAYDIESIAEVINRIHKMGCQCSIDDFGSGYSSLKMIKDCNFDFVKLDSSLFKGNNGFDSSSKLVVETMIDLSHKLGMKVVAEGIETEEQIEFLTKNKCDAVQGYYYSRPMPFNRILKIITKNNINKD